MTTWYDKFRRDVVLALVVLFALSLIDKWWPLYELDDTDAPGERSGLVLYTDAGTGCQYLRAGGGDSLIPRVDKNGIHMCGMDYE